MSVKTKRSIAGTARCGYIRTLQCTVGVYVLIRAGDRTRLHYGSHQFLNWWLQMSTGHLHLDGFESGSIPTRKREATASLFLVGAGNRTRTGTLFTARDFKSLVSTDFTMPAGY